VRICMGNDEYEIKILDTRGGKERDFTHAIRNLWFRKRPK
jgi:hypothetical protein